MGPASFHNKNVPKPQPGEVPKKNIQPEGEEQKPARSVTHFSRKFFAEEKASEKQVNQGTIGKETGGEKKAEQKSAAGTGKTDTARTSQRSEKGDRIFSTESFGGSQTLNLRELLLRNTHSKFSVESDPGVSEAFTREQSVIARSITGEVPSLEGDMSSLDTKDDALQDSDDDDGEEGGIKNKKGKGGIKKIARRGKSSGRRTGGNKINYFFNPMVSGEEGKETLQEYIKTKNQVTQRGMTYRAGIKQTKEYLPETANRMTDRANEMTVATGPVVKELAVEGSQKAKGLTGTAGRKANEATQKMPDRAKELESRRIDKITKSEEVTAQEKEKQNPNINNYKASFKTTVDIGDKLENSKSRLDEFKKFKNCNDEIQKLDKDIEAKKKNNEWTYELEAKKAELEKEKSKFNISTEEQKNLDKNISDYEKKTTEYDRDYKDSLAKTKDLHKKMIDSLPKKERNALLSSEEKMNKKGNEIKELYKKKENYNSRLNDIEKKIEEGKNSRKGTAELEKERDKIKSDYATLEKDISAGEKDYINLRKEDDKFKDGLGIGIKEPPSGLSEEEKKKYKTVDDIYAGDISAEGDTIEKSIKSRVAKKKIAKEAEGTYLNNVKESGKNIQSTEPNKAVKEVQDKSQQYIAQTNGEFNTSFQQTLEKRKKIDQVRGDLGETQRKISLAEERLNKSNNPVEKFFLNLELKLLKSKEGRLGKLKDGYERDYDKSRKETDGLENKQRSLLPPGQQKEFTGMEFSLNQSGKALNSLYQDQEKIEDTFNKAAKKTPQDREEINGLNEQRIKMKEEIRKKEEEHKKLRQELDNKRKEMGISLNVNDKLDSQKIKAVNDMYVGHVPPSGNSVEDMLVRAKVTQEICSSKYGWSQLQEMADIGTAIVVTPADTALGGIRGAEGYTKDRRLVVNSNARPGVALHEASHIIQNNKIINMDGEINNLYEQLNKSGKLPGEYAGENGRECFAEAVRVYHTEGGPKKLDPAAKKLLEEKVFKKERKGFFGNLFTRFELSVKKATRQSRPELTTDEIMERLKKGENIEDIIKSRKDFFAPSGMAAVVQSSGGQSGGLGQAFSGTISSIPGMGRKESQILHQLFGSFSGNHGGHVNHTSPSTVPLYGGEEFHSGQEGPIAPSPHRPRPGTNMEETPPPPPPHASTTA